MTVARTVLGIGTHLFRDNLEAVICHAVDRGIRHIDTAPNYGSGKSHRILGDLARAHRLPQGYRLSTKVGFLSLKEARNAIRLGVATPEEFAPGLNHVLTPAYIRYQVNINADELHKQSIDVLFLHNPEAQLSRLPLYDLLHLLRSCFETCEELCSEKRIDSYGIATWENLLTEGVLAQLVCAAKEIAGERHRFKAIQLPLSLVKSREIVKGMAGGGVLTQAHDLGLSVYGSSPFHGGKLIKMLEPGFVHLLGDNISAAQACLQFVRSSGLADVILVGCSKSAHIDEAVEVTRMDFVDEATMKRISRLLEE